MNHTTHMTASIHRDQRGLTLVEIMVAITISLLLLAGVIQIFSGTKSSYNLQNGLGRMQENGRYAMDMLARDIGMAGFYSIPADFLTKVPFPIIAANTADNVTPNVDLGLTVASGQASDIIEITYIANSDCLGNDTSAGGVAVNRYFLQGTDLMCLGNGSNTPQILAEGVENMQILYGLDTTNDSGTADPDTIAERYVSAGNVADWSSVVSVRIALLINTVDSVGGEDTGIYALLDAPPIGPIEDKLGRKVFTRTILLRNKFNT